MEFFSDITWQMMEMAEMANPSRQMFACFAEAILLEFEGIHTNFSWGRNNISLDNMDLIGAASLRHGFEPSASACSRTPHWPWPLPSPFAQSRSTPRHGPSRPAGVRKTAG